MSSKTVTDAAGACRHARAELAAMNNVRRLAGCQAMPLVVTANAVTGADGSPASSVSVTYRTERLFRIPLLSGQFTFTRTVQMAVK
jgi:hypothetical protein